MPAINSTGRPSSTTRSHAPLFCFFLFCRLLGRAGEGLSRGARASRADGPARALRTVGARAAVPQPGRVESAERVPLRFHGQVRSNQLTVSYQPITKSGFRFTLGVGPGAGSLSYAVLFFMFFFLRSCPTDGTFVPALWLFCATRALISWIP